MLNKKKSIKKEKIEKAIKKFERWEGGRKRWNPSKGCENMRGKGYKNKCVKNMYKDTEKQNVHRGVEWEE